MTREGDEITVDRRTETTTGASRETSREIEFDEGRVQEIERESTTTNRYGETIERAREIEREGSGVVSFEGEAQTSRGREVEVEGVAGRGYYGRRGVVADVDTKYRGDWTTVGRRGPYGASVARLPQGYRPYTIDWSQLRPDRVAMPNLVNDRLMDSVDDDLSIWRQ